MPVTRVAQYFLLPGSRAKISIEFNGRCDSLLTGCLFALLPVVRPDLFRRLVAIASKGSVQIVSIILLVLIAPLAFEAAHSAWLFTVGWPSENLAVGLLVLATLTGGSRLRTTLEYRPLVRLGLISYSVYLWQQLFMTPQDDLFPRFLPLRVLLVLLVATVSYVLIERPFLRLKRRFEQIPQRDHGPILTMIPTPTSKSSIKMASIRDRT